jgi:Acyl-CoA dehydrogenase, C-terminal domain
MTFELDQEASARRTAAEAVAREAAAHAVAADAAVDVPRDVRSAIGAVVPTSPADAPVHWVVAVEALAAVSPTLALVAAGDALGGESVATAAQWPGLRGVDVDGLRAAFASDVWWHLAVTATLVGAGRGAVDAAVVALKASRTTGTAAAGQALVADAATTVDASRLLLWEAASHDADGESTRVARGLARLHALDALTVALAAAEQACGAEAFRPGAALERLRRDATTVAQVLGERALEGDAVATATFPA